MEAIRELSAKAVQGPALPLQSIDHIHSGHSLPLGMLGVGDSISNHSQVPQPTQEVGWGFNALKSWKFFFRAFQNRQLAMYRAGW